MYTIYEISNSTCHHLFPIGFACALVLTVLCRFFFLAVRFGYCSTWYTLNSQIDTSPKCQNIIPGKASYECKGNEKEKNKEFYVEHILRG